MRFFAACYALLLLFDSSQCKRSDRKKATKVATSTGNPLQGTTTSVVGCVSERGRVVKDLTQQIEKGNVYFGQQDWGKALACYEGALRQDPNQKVAEINVGLVHAAKGDHAMAMAVCKPLETKYPDYEVLHYCMGLAHLHYCMALAHLGTKISFDEAIRYLELVQKAPDGARLRPEGALAEATCGLASQRLDQGKPSDAHKLALSAIKLAPTLAKAYKVLGFSCRHLGLHEEALKSFQKATILFPQDPEGWANLALVQSHTGRNSEAVASFQEAIRLHPSYIGAYQALGKHYQAIQRIPEAIETFETALKLDSKNVDLR
eukprot:CAMPEP_0198232832 /NCGR_PEP_ID=MMETSP1445-20131203/115932_1 /TAXON_ID=36898 /ORGANISM="Pyramimonas sp., Strain CCMP2087" /LENGTH=318 /DNA_ID=CAMNT_0043913517 /DNA_START=507 /DNA_END=1459 /DNA_ORIENTATION=-